MTEKKLPGYSADQFAAHELLTEIRTRIATQPLTLRHGDEGSALTSLFKIYEFSRAAIKDNPGCDTFAALTVDMLNTTLRPMTARWHRKSLEGAFRQRDQAVAFRNELEDVRLDLQAYASKLHKLAYGTDMPEPEAKERVAATFDDTELPYGIPQDKSVRITEAAQITAEESAEILKIRAANGVDVTGPDVIDATGLSFSGGGIRSAAFSLGVAQVLADKDLLRSADVMSTVSGGGFTGAFITQRIGSADHPQSDNPSAALGSPDGPDTDAISYLRRRAAYLSMASFTSTFNAACRIIAGMVLNWTAPAFLVSFLALICALVIPASGIDWTIVLNLAGFAALSGLFFYAVLLRIKTVWAERSFAVLFGMAVLLAVAWSIQWAHGLISPQSAGDLSEMSLLASLVALGAALPALSRLMPFLNHPWVRKIVSGAVLTIAAVAIPIVGLLTGVILFELGRLDYQPDAASLQGYASGLTVLTILTGLLFVAALSLNINLTAPHSFYRARIARTFIERDDHTDAVPLPTLNPDHRVPYHLINAAVNLPNSKAVSLREREADFFFMSKHWCGSPATGYHPTTDWKGDGEVLDLATAVAVSGAAVAPHMALLNIKSARMLLSFLNLRLGYWIKNPGRSEGSRMTVPGFWFLIKEMLGIGMSEDNDWLYLSDGGHIENSGVYELLRRRCKFIVAVDAGTDAGHRFHTLVTLVRHARIDLGIHISPSFDDLRLDADSGLSPAHGTLCKIHYPEGEGLLLVIKLALTGDESELIKAYRGMNESFPHQSTADQFFNEEQFEAYRQLGAHSAAGFFQPALVGNNTSPQSIAHWLRALSARLLI